MFEDHIITVKGVGNLSLPVDWVDISIDFDLDNMNYDAGYAEMAKRIALLQESLKAVGFCKEDLKTGRINVNVQYKQVQRWKDHQKEFDTVFNGYRFITGLTLSFDFDSARLGKVIQTITASKAEPKFDIRFSVKDKDAAKNMLLAEAARNARTQAETLCNALGCKLGAVKSISYNWAEVNFYSPASLELSDHVCYSMSEEAPIDFTPEDVQVKDSATFTWAIE